MRRVIFCPHWALASPSGSRRVPVTISTKGVDWPFSLEALYVAGSPCFLHKEISFSFLHRFPQPLRAVFNLSKPVSPKDRIQTWFPSPPHTCHSWVCQGECWGSVLSVGSGDGPCRPGCPPPSPGTLSEQCFMGCCCVLTRSRPTFVQGALLLLHHVPQGGE